MARPRSRPRPVALLLLLVPALALAVAVAAAGCPGGNPEAPAPPGAGTGAGAGADPLAGGPVKVLRLAGPPGATRAQIDESVAILNRRFAKATIPGKAEAEPSGAIVVSLRDDAEVLRRAGTLLAAGGHLQFLAVADEKDLPSAELANEKGRLAGLKAKGAYDGAKERFDLLPYEVDPKRSWLVHREGGVEGHYVADVSPRLDAEDGWVVDFQMNPEGQDAFSTFTKRLVKRLMAVVLDDVVKQVFTIRTEIRGTGVLFRTGGGYSKEEAQALAALMSSGRLPIDLSLEEEPLSLEAPEPAGGR